jgi:hypothetical protein
VHREANFAFTGPFQELNWERKGVLLLEFMPKGQTINAASYCATLKWLRRATQSRWRNQLPTGMFLLHDNVRPHAATSTLAILAHFAWDFFFPILRIVRTFHFFKHFKQVWGGTLVGNDEMKKTVSSAAAGRFLRYRQTGNRHTILLLPESSWELCRKMI